MVPTDNNNEIQHTSNKQNYSTNNLRNSEKIRAWILTIFLHILLIIGVYGYLYNIKHQEIRPKKNQIRDNSIKNTKSINPMETKQQIGVLPKVSQQTSSISSTTVASSIQTSNIDDFSFTLPPVTFNAPTMYFFSSSQDEEPLPIRTMTVEPTPNLSSDTTTSHQNLSIKSSTTDFLKQRDVPKKEYSILNEQSENVISNKAHINSEIDNGDNQSVIDLINQVKIKNQQQIDNDTKLSKN